MIAPPPKSFARLCEIMSIIREIKKMPHNRPNLVGDLVTSDGRKALDVALANGVSETTFRARLRRGLSVDLAVLPIERRLSAFERGEYETAFDPTVRARMRFHMKAFCRKAQSVIKAQERCKSALAEASYPKALEWLASREDALLSYLPEVEEFRPWSNRQADSASAFAMADEIAARAKNSRL